MTMPKDLFQQISAGLIKAIALLETLKDTQTPAKYKVVISEEPTKRTIQPGDIVIETDSTSDDEYLVMTIAPATKIHKSRSSMLQIDGICGGFLQSIYTGDLKFVRTTTEEERNHLMKAFEVHTI